MTDKDLCTLIAVVGVIVWEIAVMLVGIRVLGCNKKDKG